MASTSVLRPLSFSVPLLLGLACGSHALTFQVPGDFATIQAAIDSATNGDLVLVSPGVYSENLHMSGRNPVYSKNIILRSLDPMDPDLVDSTVIHGKVAFLGGESPLCEIAGFVIRNGKPGLAGNGTLATIRKNRIVENEEGIRNCDGLIEGNIVARNRGSLGAGLSGCDGRIQNNLIIGNIAEGGCETECFPVPCGPYRYCPPWCYTTCWDGIGGGFYDCDGTIVNNSVIGNTASDHGGGFAECSGSLSNNIIWDNEARNGSQLYESSNPKYSCVQDWSGGGLGNVLVDPRFINSASDDYNLRPDSPCIDAGGEADAPSVDFLGNPRPVDAVDLERGDGSDFDIGAYEFYGEGTPGQPPLPPVALSPINAELDVTLFPTLQVGPFVDLDDDDQHFATQWQLDDGTGGDDPLLDTGPDRNNLMSLYIDPQVGLRFNTPYFWRARFLDDAGVWSEWSEIGSFVTRARTSVLHVPSEFPTIQSALDYAVSGDEVIVEPGYYKEPIRFPGRNVTLRSVDPDDPSIVETTILSGPGYETIFLHFQEERWPVVTFEGTETDQCLLTGFTITRGVSPRGSGICGNGTHATIRKNVIVSNRTSSDNEASPHLGGGLFDCDGLIEDNILEANASNIGGALYDCDGVIRKNVIRKNRSTYHLCGLINSEGCTVGKGGGLSFCDGLIVNNLIYDNAAYDLAGCFFQCHGVIENNTIVYNRVLSENGQGGAFFECRATSKNNIVWGNQAALGGQLYESRRPSYCCIQDWQGGGEGNIAIDPALVNSASGDFHLLSDSPCIDAGGFIELMTDFEGNPRPIQGVNVPRGDGSFFDIGAYEFHWPTNRVSDFDGNLRLDHLDLFRFAPSWEKEMDTQLETPNLNGDFVINALDLLVFVKDWREATGAR